MKQKRTSIFNSILDGEEIQGQVEAGNEEVI